MDSITEIKNLISDITGEKVTITNTEMLNKICSAMLFEIKNYCDSYAMEKTENIIDSKNYDSMKTVCRIMSDIRKYFPGYFIEPEDVLHKKGVINKDEWNKIKDDRNRIIKDYKKRIMGKTNNMESTIQKGE